VRENMYLDDATIAKHAPSALTEEDKGLKQRPQMADRPIHQQRAMILTSENSARAIELRKVERERAEQAVLSAREQEKLEKAQAVQAVADERAAKREIKMLLTWMKTMVHNTISEEKKAAKAREKERQKREKEEARRRQKEEAAKAVKEKKESKKKKQASSSSSSSSRKRKLAYKQLCRVEYGSDPIHGCDHCEFWVCNVHMAILQEHEKVCQQNPTRKKKRGGKKN
jgi:colicin import membrane protein